MTTETLSSLREKRDAAIAAYKAGIAELQQNCEHKIKGECDGEDMIYTSDMPPIRVCMECGLNESSPYGSFKALQLKNEEHVFKLTRQEVSSLREGPDMRVQREKEREAELDRLALRRVKNF